MRITVVGFIEQGMFNASGWGDVELGSSLVTLHMPCELELLMADFNLLFEATVVIRVCRSRQSCGPLPRDVAV